MLLRRLASVFLVLSSSVLAPQSSTPKPAATAPKPSSPAPSADSPARPRDGAGLPVRRVVLYKNGVGYFEHAGRVTGTQAVTIDFTSSQLDDALQSLTALDLGGGRITGVNYNSSTPFNQQLKNIPLGLGDKPSTTDLYAALRGARVEVSGPGEAPVSGRIVHYEIRSEKNAAGVTANHRVLTIITDTGLIRSLDIGPATGVHILDGDLRRDLDDYLALLASTQSRQMRHLTLDAQGTGTRDIRVSYISEVPVWKSTYRIVFPAGSGKSRETESATLQGWAVVDNTVGSDWDNVQLSLVAGAPQSFTEPLSQPIYTTRPTVAVPEAENMAPVVHEGALAAAPAMPAASQSVTVNGALAPRELARKQLGQLHGAYPGGLATGSNVAGGVIGGIGSGSAGGSGGGYSFLQDETGSASSSRFDDFFEYTVAQPVTLHKNQSALVPFLQTSVQADRVTLWNAAEPVALRALWLTNASNLTLDRGSFSVFESGEFAGEGLTDPIHAGEKRLLSYAVDQAVHISTEGRTDSMHLRHLTAHNGVLSERTEEIREITYVVHNAASDARNVILEHPVEDGWKLNSDPSPIETSASFYRFRVAAGPGEIVRLHVGQTHIQTISYALTGMDDQQLDILIKGSGDRAAIEKALAPVLAARAKLADLETRVDAKQKDIDRVETDSKRLHDNLVGLKDSPEERTLARRYAGEMNTDEDQLQTLRKDRADLEQQQKAAQQALDDAIASLNLDEDV
jgi:hypothetical protein